MVRKIKVTTPIPSLEEFGKTLGLSQRRQKALALLMKDQRATLYTIPGRKGKQAFSSTHIGPAKAVKTGGMRKGQSKRATASA